MIEITEVRYIQETGEKQRLWHQSRLTTFL